MCDNSRNRVQIPVCFVPGSKAGIAAVMTRIAFLALLPLITISCSNDNKGATELFPVRMGGQYGYMDRNGKMAIAAQYSQGIYRQNG